MLMDRYRQVPTGQEAKQLVVAAVASESETVVALDY